jgi:hypothetical protein
MVTTDTPYEAEAERKYWQAQIDAGGLPTRSPGEVAMFGVEALRAEVFERLRNPGARTPARSEPRDPPPAEADLIAAYKDAKAKGCDNREAQDKYVYDLYGTLSKKARETARLAAKVRGKPGPEPKK